MIDRTHAGLRCHTRHLLRTVKGELSQGSEGTVVFSLATSAVLDQAIGRYNK